MRSLALIACGALALSACHSHQKAPPPKPAPKTELATLYHRGALICVNNSCGQITSTGVDKDFNPNDKAVVDAINDNFIACRDTAGVFDPADTKKSDKIFDCIKQQIEASKSSFKLEK